MQHENIGCHSHELIVKGEWQDAATWALRFHYQAAVYKMPSLSSTTIVALLRVDKSSETDVM